jgi:hypothetical protein
MHQKSAMLSTSSKRPLRGGSAGGVATEAATLRQDTLAFKFGLADTCPRCGWQVGSQGMEQEEMEKKSGRQKGVGVLV